MCDVAHQKGGGDFAVGLNFEFFYLMYKSFFLSFKITPHSSKLIKAFKFYNREFLCKGLAAILEVTLNSIQYLLG